MHSVWCDAGDDVTHQLMWKPGTLENVVSPFEGNSLSSVEFPDGLRSENFGVFVCTSLDGYTENFIVDCK